MNKAADISFDELKTRFYSNHKLLKEYSQTDPIYHKIYQENQTILKQVDDLLTVGISLREGMD